MAYFSAPHSQKYSPHAHQFHSFLIQFKCFSLPLPTYAHAHKNTRPSYFFLPSLVRSSPIGFSGHPNAKAPSNQNIKKRVNALRYATPFFLAFCLLLLRSSSAKQNLFCLRGFVFLAVRATLHPQTPLLCSATLHAVFFGGSQPFVSLPALRGSATPSPTRFRPPLRFGRFSVGSGAVTQ